MRPKPNSMKRITVSELKEKIDKNEDFQLIDIREKFESEICSIDGSEHIPMIELIKNTHKIRKDVDVIIYCHTDGRSYAVVNHLINRFNFNNVYNLVGGINEWALVIEPDMVVY
jgi:rhodanese-related sulfurtransferase